jgi:hypothetical protein
VWDKSDVFDFGLQESVKRIRRSGIRIFQGLKPFVFCCFCGAVEEAAES